MKKENIHISALVLVLICACGAGCDSGYTEPAVAHTYETSTQAPHEVTGLQLALDGEITYVASVYIDGRKVVSTPAHGMTGINTFVQLPPGRHQLTLIGTVVLLPDVDYKGEFLFELREGQRGTFRVRTGNLDQDIEKRRRYNWTPPWSFDNVESWTVESEYGSR